MSFFRKGDTGLENVAVQTITMLSDARHSFDLASAAVLSGADPTAIGDDIRKTDQRINEAEQRLRSQLVVHVSVQGGAEIGSVMAYTLLLKKIERIGDQAKNILDLAEEGVTLQGAADAEEFLRHRRAISDLYVEAGELLASHDKDQARGFIQRALDLKDECDVRIHEYMHSKEPGEWAVPRAILYRYWKRIIANLAGIVTSAIEPLQHVDYLDDGTVDIDDD